MKIPNPQSPFCRDASAWIHLLLDGELVAEQHEQLLAHVQTCASCSAAYRELTMIEAAHAELDEHTLAPPMDYFEKLPERVLARIEQEEQRAPARAKTFARAPRAFKLWDWLGGRGRYAIAFAAMLALVFIVTQQLREEGATETAMQKLPQTAARDVTDFSDMPRPASLPQTQGRAVDSIITAKPSAPPRRFAQGLQTQTSPEPPARQAQEFPSQTEEARLVHVAEAESKADPEQQAPTTFNDTLPVAAEVAAQAVSHFAAQPQALPSETTLQARSRKMEEKPSFRALTKMASEQERESIRSDYVTRRAHERETRNELLHVLDNAARAQNEAERIKIWQNFLRYNEGDSASYTARVENVALALAASVDSSAAVATLQEASFFYQSAAAVLVARWGEERYAREKSRWEGLLNWKKNAER